MTENLPEDKAKSEDEIKHQALIDNTAQGIFNHLKEIENKREIYEKRWIWELLQNALDVAPQDRKIEVEIIKNDRQITFKHNGRPFRPEEVAHLIYHGSTKREQDIGKFGTGFLTTHLLSRKVEVKGIREDGKKFEFTLDRNENSSDEIKKRMEETWEQYKRSLSEKTKNSTGYAAEYQYPLNDVSSKTVEAGVDDLIKIAPYVLAFNDKLGAIEIISQGRKLKFELVNENNELGYINKIVEEGKPPIPHELWMIKVDEVEMSVKGKKQSDGTYQIESLQDVPKIFFAFPLFGTQDLPFPAVINSRKFEPTEKRDGIFLGRENTVDIKQNKELLEKANKSVIPLVSKLVSNKWEGVHTLLKFGPLPERDWLDRDWYNGLLKGCIGEILKSKVLKAENGTFIAPDEGLIPIFDSFDEEKVKRLWDLCYCFLDYKDKIPAKELAFDWAQIIDSWKSLGLDLTERQITIEKIATEIERSGRLQDFKTKLGNDVDEMGTLNDFYGLLLDVEKRALFDNKKILPDQNGNFKKKPDLSKDKGIDETLKDISGKLGIDVRTQLLHLRVSGNVQILLSVKKQEEVLNQVINNIKQPRPEDDQYLQANIALFNWLLEHDKFESLEGYPLLSLKQKTFVYLGKDRKDKPLAPKNVWNEKGRGYEVIFPQEFLISPLYFEKISQNDKWNKLSDKGLIYIDPLYQEEEKISGEDMEFFLASGERLEEKVHGIANSVEISKIAFLGTKDKGIIDTIRGSREKARKFLMFIFDYVLETDPYWENVLEVECDCGQKHKICPSELVFMLKKRHWVPAPKDKPLTSMNLALVLEGHEELLGMCKQDTPTQFLNILNISISELMMHVAAKGDQKTKLELDKAMGSLFGTFMTNPSQLSKIAQLAKSDPGLFIKEMEERLSTREQIRKNKSIGSLVEKLLKSVLEKEGFKVERTGVGSDFVVENDFVEDDVEIIFEVKKENATCSYYIEVKATTQDFVRMTLTQAKEARDNPSKYALCVIELNGLEPNEENIKNGAKFVTDIGEKIQVKVGEAENLKDEQEKIAGSGDIEIEISEDPIRFKINEGIWEDSKTLDQFFTFLRGRNMDEKFPPLHINTA